MTFLVTRNRNNEMHCSGIVLSAWRTSGSFVTVVYSMKVIDMPMTIMPSRVLAARASLETHSLTIVNRRENHKVISETCCNATGTYVPPSESSRILREVRILKSFPARQRVAMSEPRSARMMWSIFLDWIKHVQHNLMRAALYCSFLNLWGTR
jgi:hypothetical protein